MKLICDWRRVVKKAWSFRLAILTAALSAIEVAVQILAAERPSPYFAAAAGITGLFSALSRVWYQSSMRNEKDDS